MKRLAQHLWLWCGPSVLFVAIVAVLALFAWAVPRVFGAQEVQSLVGPPKLLWITCTPTLGANGQFSKFVIGAEYARVVVQPSGDVEVTPIGTIQFDLLEGNGSVVAPDNIEYADKAIAAALVARALKEFNRTHPSSTKDLEESLALWREHQRNYPGPLPTRRKSLRQ